MLEVKEVQILSEQEKTISLFEFIKELNKLKQKVVLNIKDLVLSRKLLKTATAVNNEPLNC